MPGVLWTGYATARSAFRLPWKDHSPTSPTKQQKAVAHELGITTQAVSKAVARAQWTEEHAARPAAARLLALILEVH